MHIDVACLIFNDCCTIVDELENYNFDPICHLTRIQHTI